MCFPVRTMRIFRADHRLPAAVHRLHARAAQQISRGNIDEPSLHILGHQFEIIPYKLFVLFKSFT